ncbi:MAG: protein translocase subunit SecD [Chloroflexota bacterium]|nr:protein translocase subunit SecD [Chloroflexota bacterium]
MKKSKTWQLVVIILIALVALYVDLNIEHPDYVKNLLFWQPEKQRDIALRLGLDLQGGLQVLLAADVAAEQELDADSMETVRRIVENRINGMGLTEPIVQAQGERRIIVELPGVENPEQAVETIKGTALLEFVDAGHIPLPSGTIITTTLGGPQTTSPEEVSPLVPGEPGPSVSGPVTPTQPIPSPGGMVYETIFTGAGLKNVGLNPQQGEYAIPFELEAHEAQIFADYTTSHVGQHLCIVLDKAVISCPVVEQPIPSGQASISGKFTFDEARQLALQLRYGALPVPLRVESFNRIGATLGAESVQKSIRAGAIGLVIVLLFMLIYYRLPGGLADVALIIYVLINFALYKIAPITLTLPGIAGFILSAGMAVDANILIFERMKEELRRGRSLMTAIDVGFNRAWPSIRDGQLSTLIICAILFFFGTNFGASIVKGFAITLAIGTIVNVFTAVFATRTFVHQVAASAGQRVSEHKWLLGV